MEEFNLSEKIKNAMGYSMIDVPDIKEFIKRLKKCFGISIIGNKPYPYYSAEMIYEEIDKLAGKKLI